MAHKLQRTCVASIWIIEKLVLRPSFCLAIITLLNAFDWCDYNRLWFTSNWNSLLLRTVCERLQKNSSEITQVHIHSRMLTRVQRFWFITENSISRCTWKIQSVRHALERNALLPPVASVLIYVFWHFRRNRDMNVGFCSGSNNVRLFQLNLVHELYFLLWFIIYEFMFWTFYTNHYHQHIFFNK